MMANLFSYRIFWKEYRQMRGFWISVLALTVLLQLIVAVPLMGSPGANDALYALAICFSALYALGCGATAFAVEHENGTYDFLRSLPTKTLPTFLGKAAFTAVSAPLLALAAYASAAAFGRLMGEAIRFEWEALAVWGGGSMLLFVWATLFSLLMRHAVKAALFGGVAAALSVPLIIGFVSEVLGLHSTTPFAIAFAVLVTIITTIDVCLGVRWFREAPVRTRRDELERRREEFARSYGAYELEMVAPPGSTFAHLLWLQWQQSRGMVLALSLLVAWFVCAEIWLVGFEESVRRSYTGFSVLRYTRNIASALAVLGILVGCAVVPAAGASVFAGDQRQSRFRFLADRGLSPNLVWWSRHPVWMMTVLVWLMVTLVPMLILVASKVAAHDVDGKYLVYGILQSSVPTLLGIALAYSFGQLCSMVFRSGILCVTVALVGSALLVLWTLGMQLLQVPLIWSVAPIPAVLLIATRVRTRGWLIENNTLRGWLPVVLILIVPAAAILLGVGSYRAFSLPQVAPGFDVAAFTAPATPEAVETARMYARAFEELHAEANASEQTDRDDEDQEEVAINPVALIMEASRRDNCDRLEDFLPGPKPAERVEKLADAVLKTGTRLEDQGNLDAALDHYLAVLRMAQQVYHDPTLLIGAYNTENAALMALARWSTHPGQTKERVLAALRSLEQLVQHPAPWDNAIKADYVERTRVIEGDMDDMFDRLGSNPGSALLIYWMPWERERARRMLRLVTASELDRYQRIRSSLARGYQPNLSPPQAPHVALPRTRFEPDAWLVSDNSSWVRHHLMSSEFQRRATRLTIALVAWQLEHDSLPQSLQELKGEYFKNVPLDPYSGEPFVYFPDGINQRLSNWSFMTGEGGRVTDNSPFFWSTGPGISVVQRGEGISPTVKYQLRPSEREIERATTPQQVWSAGQFILIPHPR